MTTAEPTRSLRVEEVAVRAGVSRRTVVRAVAAGELPRLRLGHRTARYNPADVDVWIRAREDKKRAAREWRRDRRTQGENPR